MRDDSSVNKQRESTSFAINKYLNSTQGGIITSAPEKDDGYNVHADFAAKYPQKESTHTVIKLMAVLCVVVIGGACISHGVEAYTEKQNQEADIARQDFAAEVANMDLTPYCKKYIMHLAVTKTDFNRTGGTMSLDDLYHCNNITIEGEAVGTQRLSHQQVYNYMYTTMIELYDEIDEICNSSLYLHHLKRGHAIEYGHIVYNYENQIMFYLRDSINEYYFSISAPPNQVSNNNFYVETISSENKGEKWSYKVTDEDAEPMFELYTHYDSDAVRAERNRKYRSYNYGSSSKSNSSSSYGSSTKRRSGSTYKKKDTYNSSRYKDADSFAEDHYEDFYDYDDYEDDDDAYDAAVDYWNDWND